MTPDDRDLEDTREEEDYDNSLVRLESGSMDVDKRINRYNEWKGKCEVDWMGIGGLYTHWRPLPEPPESEE